MVVRVTAQPSTWSISRCSAASQPPTTQVAAQMRAPTPLVESSFWVDGVALLVKGGGSPTRGTIYGATDGLRPGKHVLVAYARTATAATAIAATFRVR